MRRTNQLAVLMILLAGTSLPAQELPFQLDVPLPGITGFSSDIPVHSEIIGHEIGTRHTDPAQVVRYFEALAAASDRIVLREHARSYEGRPLIHAIVTSPANHARLEQIRSANQRLSDDAANVSDAEIAGMPAIVYQGFSIHGNEATGTEAALLHIYTLAAASGPWIDSVLANTVLIVDPMFNPDGRDRFVDWVNRNRGATGTTDGQDREHNEPWPGGRTNHYWFDLNRDWLPVEHPESRGRIETFHSWRPQLLTDHHEMGGNATFFFQPGVASRNNPNTPQRTFDVTQMIAEYHAEALDRLGSLYYSAEGFDDFYYGKGSTFPDVNGAVGILFEQASSRALRAETRFGELTYAEGVRNQFATAISTVQAALSLRETLLRNQRDFYREAPSVARSMNERAWVVGSDEYSTRTYDLLQLLSLHRIRVHELAREVQADGQTFRPGEAWVIPTDQPQARLIKAVMEYVTEYQDSLFYDVSAWTLPLAYGVPAAGLTSVNGVMGPMATLVQPVGSVSGGRAGYAYLMEWGRYYSGRAMRRLIEAGVIPYVVQEPFRAMTNGTMRDFRRGTVVVPVNGRDTDAPDAATVHSLVREIALLDNVDFHGVDGGLTPSGVDMGSPSGQVIEMPRIALLSGSGTSSYGVGEAWHLMSHRFGMTVSLLDLDRLGRADLERYNTIVMADVFGLSDDATEALDEFVRGGGLIVATGASVSTLNRAELLEFETRSAERDTTRIAYAEASQRSGAQQLGGSIFEIQLDTTHPLAFGHPAAMPVFRNSRTFIEPTGGTSTVAVYSDDPVLSGYISEENLAVLPGSAAIIAGRRGSGRIVAMVDNPNFRAFWRGTNTLFINALLLGQAY